MEHDYTIQFEYYRIPEDLYLQLSKGRPRWINLHRYFRGDGFAVNKSYAPLSKGGATSCTITALDNTQKWSATAYCSYSDNFCYKIGREIALGRAKKQLEKRRNK